jgi:hypothetical protein
LSYAKLIRENSMLSNSPSPSPSPTAQKLRAYRERQAAAGNRELTLMVPQDVIAFLDDIKAAGRLSSRSQAVMLLIEQGRKAARQTA